MKRDTYSEIDFQIHRLRGLMLNPQVIYIKMSTLRSIELASFTLPPFLLPGMTITLFGIPVIIIPEDAPHDWNVGL